MDHLIQEIEVPVLVGTWAAAWWAIRFYEKHGFKLVTPTEGPAAAQLLDHLAPSGGDLVVLGDEEWFGSELAR